MKIPLVLQDFEALDCGRGGDIGLTAEVVEGVADRLSRIVVDINYFASRTLLSYPSQLEGIVQEKRELQQCSS